LSLILVIDAHFENVVVVDQDVVVFDVDDIVVIDVDDVVVVDVDDVIVVDAGRNVFVRTSI
jgi:hypothetical protein